MSLYLSIIYVVCIVLMSGISYLVLKKNIKSHINWYFAIMNISAIIWTIALWISFSINPTNTFLLNIFTKLAFALPILSLSCLCIFFYYFPKKTLFVHKVFEYSFIVFTLLLFLMTLFTPLINKAQIVINNIYVGDTLGSFYFLYVSHAVFCLMFSILIAIQKLFHTCGIQKKKVLFILYGALSASIIVVGTNIVLPIFDIGDPLFFQKIAPPFLLIFITIFSYSLYNHRFFHVSFISLTLIRKSIITLVFFLSIILVNHLLYFIYPNINNLFVILLSTFIGIECYKISEKAFPEFLSSSFRQFRNKIREFHGKLMFCQNYQQLKTILDYYFTVQLNVSSAEIYIIRSKKTNVKENIPIYIRNKFTEEVGKNKIEILVKNELNVKNDIIDGFYLSYLDDLKAAICVPLFSEKIIIGLFILGEKANQKEYSREEIEEILKIKNDIEIASINTLITSNLKAENNLMRQIVENKTKNLKKQNKEIKGLLRQQQDFMAVTAHEFRTPLSIAMFQLEDTLDSYKKNDEVKEEMKVVESSLNDLKHLTQKLFDIQQYDLEKVELSLGKVNIHEYFQKIYHDFTSIMSEKSLEFLIKNTIPKNTNIRIDADQFKQVISNLLTNAFKFTPINGIIILKLETINNKILISISDTGKGIPDEDKTRIFEKFQTVNSAMGMGIGLGLYLCKKITELHKGKIWIEDSKLGGAKFCIEI